MAKGKKFVDLAMSGVKTPAQMKAEMAVDRAKGVLPKAERDANLEKMLDESAVKERLYHGTTSDITEFDQSKARSKTGNINALLGTFMSDNPVEANRFASEWGSTGGNVMPVYASLKNPYHASYKEMDDLAMGVYRRMMQDPSYDPNRVVKGLDKEGHQRTFKMIEKHEPGALQDAVDFKNKLIESGHDGIIWNLNGNKEVIAFEPTQIKSAIGNRGTYDTSDPDITKAHGGIIKMGKGGVGRKLGDKILPKVEAPSVMTRSELTELADYIKNREGGYGLRRVERAADEIPRLGEMYTQDALRSAFSGDNARALMTMKPADFERYSAPLLTDLSQSSKDNIANLKAIQKVGGFSDVPYFFVNKELAGSTGLPWITGHEGRHRSRAMDEAGVQAGLVQFLPRAELREPFPRRSQEQYIEAIRKEMELSGNKIKPEKYYLDEKDEKTFQRPTINLPDLYANGGAVKMAEGGEVNQAELDRMRLELNSPVIQATPQTFTQRAIGTLGGYMNQAGEFVTEAIKPLEERNPVKHFLADMFLAGSLKSAGTALQDYTGTVREEDEDNPVRGVISKDWKKFSTSKEPMLDPRVLDVLGFAQPVARVGIKAGKAGVKAATPFAKDVGEMASEMYMRGDMPFMPSPNAYAVSPDGKPSKVLAPANEIGFYSPTEAAALNLQRKSGQGQAFLNDIMKGENVKADEISAMGLDTFLKGKTNVTADEVRDYIAQNKIQLGENIYQDKPNFVNFLKNKGLSPEDAESMYYKAENRDPVADEYLNEYTSIKKPKFSSYALPGGENYREIVLTLPTEGRGLSEIELDKINRRLVDKGYDGLDEEQRIVAMRGGNEAMDMLQDLEDRVGIKTNDLMKTMAGGDPSKQYRSSHWDEANPLAHLRVSDRVTDGKKTLLVDEVQSDWHQAGRERGYQRPIDVGSMSADDILFEYRNDLSSEQKNWLNHYIKEWEEAELDGNTKTMDRLTNYLSDWASKQKIGEIPNAPYKDDWYQLTLRRAIKEAVDGGYDRVALPTGARVAERFDLSKQVDRIVVAKLKDGTFAWNAQKDGRIVQDQVAKNSSDLSLAIGKDLAKKAEAQTDIGANSIYEGNDLRVGGEGMKKYYDEIYPTYLKKFGKKYGANVGMTSVQIEPPTDKIFRDLGKFHAYTGQGRETKEFNTYAEALEFLGLGKEPLHYMEITPAMRKEFSTGIHMKRGGKVQFAKSLDAMRHELTKAK
jgi:hypothetical protein